MSSQISITDTTFLTNITGHWVLLCVRNHMSLQIVCFCKIFWAFEALYSTFPVVDKLMTIESGLTVEYFPTILKITSIIAVLTMFHNVFTQVILSPERVLTNWACERLPSSQAVPVIKTLWFTEKLLEYVGIVTFLTHSILSFILFHKCRTVALLLVIN